MTERLVNIDTLIEKSLGAQMKKDMEIALRAVYDVAKKYSYLYDGDIQETQNLLREAFLLKDTPILVNDEVQVDMKIIVSNVPESVKDQIYTMVQEKLAATLDLESMANKE